VLPTKTSDARFVAMARRAVCLFAARPDLPQKIIGALARDEVSGQRTALLHYVFVSTPCEAFWAEHDWAGYQVKCPQQRNLAMGALEFGQVISDAHETLMAAKEKTTPNGPTPGGKWDRRPA
jgi:hypothetical protein